MTRRSEDIGRSRTARHAARPHSRPSRLLAASLPLAALLLGCGAFSCAGGPARAAEPAPFELIRSLQALQDQIAQGNSAAQATQPKMVAHIARSFVAADPKVWHERKNLRAAVIYLFSGGQPEAVRTILEQPGLDKGDVDLLKGALAYAEGRDGEARGRLMDIDPFALPSNLGGHLALVQATLTTTSDPQKALRLLDTARLLVPGTLVEEAALRREIFMIGDKGDLDKFTLLARQYMRRFGKAVYADNFRQRFSEMVAEIGLSDDLAHVQRLEKILADLGPEEQTKLWLSVAQTALLQGRIEIARYAAGKAVDHAGDRPADVARANLYLGAALIVTEDYDKGVALLRGIEATRLSERDEELRKAAADVAAAIRTVTKVEEAAVDEEAGTPSGQTGDAGQTRDAGRAKEANPTEDASRTKTWPVMDRALAAIGSADALLSRPTP